jgi:hypothetical protein
VSALTASRDERTAVETLLDFRCEVVILLEPGSARVPVLAGRLPVTAIGWRVDNPSVDVVRTSDEEGMGHAVDPSFTWGTRPSRTSTAAPAQPPRHDDAPTGRRCAATASTRTPELSAAATVLLHGG